VTRVGGHSRFTLDRDASSMYDLADMIGRQRPRDNRASLGQHQELVGAITVFSFLLLVSANDLQ